MTIVYGSIDEVPFWDDLTDFDTLTVATSRMVAAALRVQPFVAGDVGLKLSVAGDVGLRPSVAGDVDLAAV